MFHFGNLVWLSRAIQLFNRSFTLQIFIEYLFQDLCVCGRGTSRLVSVLLSGLYSEAALYGLDYRTADKN